MTTPRDSERAHRLVRLAVSTVDELIRDIYWPDTPPEKATTAVLAAAFLAASAERGATPTKAIAMLVHIAAEQAEADKIKGRMN